MNEIYSSARIVGYDQNGKTIIKRFRIYNFGTDKQRYCTWPYIPGDYFYPKSIERKAK